MSELAPTPEALAAAYEIFYGRPADPAWIVETAAAIEIDRYARFLMDPVVERARIIDRHMPQVDERYRRAS